MTLPLHLREPGKFSDETVASMMKRRAQRARGQKPQQVKQQMKKGKKLIRQQGDDPNRELETRQKMVSHWCRCISNLGGAVCYHVMSEQAVMF